MRWRTIGSSGVREQRYAPRLTGRSRATVVWKLPGAWIALAPSFWNDVQFRTRTFV